MYSDKKKKWFKYSTVPTHTYFPGSHSCHVPIFAAVHKTVNSLTSVGLKLRPVNALQ